MPVRGACGLPFVLVTSLIASLLAPSAAGAIEAARGHQSLGQLEQQAVDDALAARGLVIDPAPQGKRIGAVHVVNHEVFSPRDSYLQLLNIFHRTTREGIIRREVLVGPGDLYDESLVDETVRNLRDADFSSLVVILPVQSPFPGQVDLLVVTRDVWSLRFNTDFEQEAGQLIYLTTSLSENNLFGHRKKAAMAFNLYRSNYAFGPAYVDPNVLGTHLTFSASYFQYINRDTNHSEGPSLGARLDYPLWALSRKWGAGIGFSHSDLVYRSYLGTGLRPIDLTSTATTEALPYIYRARRDALDASVTRSFGQDVIQRVSAGYSLSVVRPRFYEGFPSNDPDVRAAFAAQVFPLSQRLSAVYASYGLFTPRYRVYRDYSTYDLREDAQLGPSVSLSVSRAASWLGSELEYVGWSSTLAWAHDLGDGYQRAAIGWSGQLRDGRLLDQSRTASVTLASPMLGGLVRLVGEVGGAVLVNNTHPDSFYTAGGDTGLRGYPVGAFRGQAEFLAHLEARTRPIAVAALRFGGLAFYDVGDAAATASALRAFQDVGLGVRLLIPQLNFYVLRVDIAFPLQEAVVPGLGTTPAGHPRISAGFRQVF